MWRLLLYLGFLSKNYFFHVSWDELIPVPEFVSVQKLKTLSRHCSQVRGR